MKRILLAVIIAWLGISCIPSQGRHYSINKDRIEEYRNSPITNSIVLEIIETNSHFIHLSDNPYLSEATLEHHLIEKIEKDGNTTFIVFEYFSLEGVSCTIIAVTINKQNELKSILRLAEYEEYPDGILNESSFLHNDFATRITVLKGLQGYNDSLDQFTMRVDSTIITYKLNNFQKIELIDSVFKHHESIE